MMHKMLKLICAGVAATVIVFLSGCVSAPGDYKYIAGKDDVQLSQEVKDFLRRSEQRFKVAVLPESESYRNKYVKKYELNRLVGDKLEHQCSRLSTFDVIARQELDVVLDEQDLNNLSTADPSIQIEKIDAVLLYSITSCALNSDYFITTDYDLEKLRADRKKRNTYHDGGITRNLSYRKVLITDRQADSDGSLYPVDKLPFVPASKKDRLARCLSIFEMQAMGLVRRCEVVGYHPVIGVSGGLDSTLALLVCAFAMKKADRSLSDITAITLPCFGTTGRTHSNALDLMKKLGVTSLEIDIKEACTLHCRDIDHPKDSFDVTYENIQARERTQVLMDYACKIGGFVVGTGDLSELALGWCTYNADHMSMYGVNAGVPKTLIRWMIESVMENELFPQVNDILKDILATPISPELLPPDEKGNIVQQTEELIGPYALHDFFLYYMLRFGFSPDKIFLLAKRAFLQDFSPKTILHWEKVFYRRFFSQQFKRSCLPDGVKVGSVALSPRGDWRMPSDASARMWLDVLEQIDE